MPKKTLLKTKTASKTKKSSKEAIKKGKKMTKELEVLDVTGTNVESLTANEISTNELVNLVKKILEENKAAGFAYCLIGQDNKVIPFVGAKSIEQLLLMQKVISLEVDRIFTSASTPTQTPQA